MPLIRCPLRKVDRFQRRKQGNTFLRFTLIQRCELLHSYDFLSSFLSLTCMHTLTHNTIELYNFTMFQTFKLKTDEIGGGGVGVWRQEKFVLCPCGGRVTVKFHPASYATATEEVRGGQFHRFNWTLPGFVVKCSNMPLILPLKYYICWKLEYLTLHISTEETPK